MLGSLLRKWVGRLDEPRGESRCIQLRDGQSGKRSGGSEGVEARGQM